MKSDSQEFTRETDSQDGLLNLRTAVLFNRAQGVIMVLIRKNAFVSSPRKKKKIS